MFCFVCFFFDGIFWHSIYIYIWTYGIIWYREDRTQQSASRNNMFFFFLVTFFSGIDISICIYPSVYVEILWLLLMLLLWLRGWSKGNIGYYVPMCISIYLSTNQMVNKHYMFPQTINPWNHMVLCYRFGMYHIQTICVYIYILIYLCIYIYIHLRFVLEA